MAKEVKKQAKRVKVEEVYKEPFWSKVKTFIQKVFMKFKDYGYKAWRFATAKPNEKENAFQYLFRQLILTDSSGNPSWTVTALVFVLALIGFTMFIEYKLALSALITFSPEGQMLTWQLKGLSTEFYYLLIPLSVVITNLFKARKKSVSGDSSSIIDTAKDVITKIKTKL